MGTCSSETNLGSDWSCMGVAARGPMIQIYTAGNGTLNSCSW